MGASGIRSTGSALVRPALPGGRRPWRTAAAALVACGVLLTGACSDDDKSPAWKGSDGQAPGAASVSPTPEQPQTTAVITKPAADAKDVLAGTDLAFTTENG